MTYIFRFWYFLRNPSALTAILDKELKEYQITGYKKNVWTLFLLTLLLFAARNSWGMQTVHLTEILAGGQQDLFIFSRYLALIGSLIYGALFFLFHYYLVTYLLHLLTDIPYKWIQKVQLYVIMFVLIEKLFTFVLFMVFGYSTIYSPFSSAAIWAQFTTYPWLLFFMNQLTLSTFATIVVQYIFIEQWEIEGKKVLLLKLIILQVLFAAIIAAISISPLTEWLLRGLS